jgi:hypothetical protein
LVVVVVVLDLEQLVTAMERLAETRLLAHRY